MHSKYMVFFIDFASDQTKYYIVPIEPSVKCQANMQHKCKGANQMSIS